MESFLESRPAARAPLADRMRPVSLDDFMGQQHLIGPGRLLRRAIMADRLTSSIFYGPPGCGKTTLASIIAATTRMSFVKLNAVTTGVGELREVLKAAEARQRDYGQSTLLLLDECHRWNKAQSDALLPALERGTLCFIGSTTENPMINMTPALVSRCRIFEFKALQDQDVIRALRRALTDEERGFGRMEVEADADALAHIASVANGDVRSALNALELAVLTTAPEAGGRIHVTLEVAEESIQRRVLQMDESYFYDMLSAFCKSLRGSDPDAALAWFARMIEGGVDPHIITRRMIVHAAEDVGLAAPDALLQATAAAQALDRIGMPEARIPIAQAIIFICESPKSNAASAAVDRAFASARNTRHEPVPLHLKDTHYKGSDKIKAGEGYLYPHDFPGHYVKQDYMPASARGEHYYEPSDMGFERRISDLRQARMHDKEG